MPVIPEKMISKSIAQMPMNMDDQSSKKPIAILKKEYPRGRRCTIFNLTDEKKLLHSKQM